MYSVKKHNWNLKVFHKFYTLPIKNENNGIHDIKDLPYP